MKTEYSYDPEDIESLMRHKHFGELYPEEKAFVMLHLSGEEEYESMRKMLHELLSSSSGHRMEDPDPSIKDHLIALIREEKKKRFSIWLNSLFAMPSIPWYRQRGFQLAMAIFIVGFGVIAFWPSSKNDQQQFAALESRSIDTESQNPMKAPLNEEAYSETLLTSKPPMPVDEHRTITYSMRSDAASNMDQETPQPKAVVTESLQEETKIESNANAAPIVHADEGREAVQSSEAERPAADATASQPSVHKEMASIIAVDKFTSNQSLKEKRKLIDLLRSSHP